MLGSSHRCFGAVCGAGLAVATQQSIPLVIVSTLAATFTAGGLLLSPDVDQARWWRRLNRFVPDGGLMSHRGITHWWAIPVVAAVVFGHPLALLPGRTGHIVFVVCMALWTGWVSHLVGDATFGFLSLGPTGRKKRIGLGLATGGFIERIVVRPACVLALIGLGVLAVL